MVRVVFLTAVLVLMALALFTTTKATYFVNPCNLPPDPGPCEAVIFRYYYDSSVNKCKKFIYGGCQGNTNNFEGKEQCKILCVRDDYH